MHLYRTIGKGLGMWLLVDMIEEEGRKTLNVVDEISASEVRRMQELLSFVGAYNTSNMAFEIVKENGQAVRRFLRQENLRSLANDRSDIIRDANRLTYNFAASIKTFIDITERFINKDFGSKALKSYHDDVQKPTFDNCFEYALFVRLRNYVVHRMYPYTRISVSEAGVDLSVVTEDLLQWDGWTVLKDKIKARGPKLRLEEYVFRATASVLAIWIAFVGFYGDRIVSAWNEYASFAKKWGLRGYAGFAEVERREDIVNGMNVNPLPISELIRCFEVLRQNPNVKINWNRI
jgi:hypothetical protein